MAERSYSQRVPAVSRAVLALQALVAARGPLSLSALSRHTGSSPSSLLAVLNTLRHSGLVQRRDADGLYQPGPRLAALGAGAARHLGAHAAFEAFLGPGELLAEAESAIQEALGEGAPSYQAAGPLMADDLDAFLRRGLVANLSYLSHDGYPATVPLWYDWDPAPRIFWLVPHSGAEWAAHVRRSPRVSLAVSESTPPLRRVLARGSVQFASDADGELWQMIRVRLAERYAGLDAARYLAGQPPALLRLAPERLIAWRGLLQHPARASHLPRQRNTA